MPAVLNQEPDRFLLRSGKSGGGIAELLAAVKVSMGTPVVRAENSVPSDAPRLEGTSLAPPQAAALWAAAMAAVSIFTEGPMVVLTATALR